MWLFDKKFVTTEMKDCEKKLSNYYKKLEQANKNYDIGMRKHKCSCCEHYKKRENKEYENQFIECPAMECSKKMRMIVTEVNEITKTIDDFINNVFAKMVYEKGEKIKPKLIHNSTKKVYDWREIFSEDYNKVTKLRKRYLIDLVSGEGVYRLK